MTRSDDEEPFLSDEFLDDEDEVGEDENDQRRIVLHVYDDESKEFTSLTTYHGMVRIYNSNTWPSLIFWCLVVTTCVTLFMIHSGILLHFYLSRPTFLQRTHRIDDGMNFPTITVCQQPEVLYPEERNQNCLWKLLYQTNVSQCSAQWENLERGYESRHNRTLSIRELLLNSKISPVHVFLNDVDVTNRTLRERFLSEYGVCESLDVSALLPLSSLNVEIESARSDVLFSLQKKARASHLNKDGLHVAPGRRAFTTFRIVKEHFLEKGNRGSCRPNADIADCTERCKAKEYANKCNCLPFHITNISGHSATECNMSTMLNCIQKIDRPTAECACLVACRRTNYRVVTFTYSKLPPSKRNSTVITVKQTNNLAIEYLQLKRFKTVDLLSFVAGSMGLFLGMSCVTLMEIFMYLFKSVWGMVNSTRHKEFLEKLLGESVENPIDETDGKELKRSHEEIVITVNGRNENDVITLDHELLGNRRLSFIPLNKSKLDKSMYNSKWELAIPPRLELTRSRASTLDSKFFDHSFDHNQ